MTKNLIRDLFFARFHALLLNVMKSRACVCEKKNSFCLKDHSAIDHGISFSHFLTPKHLLAELTVLLHFSWI